MQTRNRIERQTARLSRRAFLAAAAALPAFGIDSLELFDFRRNLWINLHHFLYSQAQRDPRDRDREPAAGWAEAIAYYNKHLISRSLIDDPDLIAIKQRLSGLPDAGPVEEAGLEPELQEALKGAAPVYRDHWWEAHDRANALWIQSQLPRLSDHGATVAGALGRVLDTPWPAEPVLTEISYTAHINGAYTTLKPLFVTIASGDPRNQGDLGFEILFHEASHGLAGKTRRLLAAELAAHAKTSSAPSSLWHAVLFYCVGQVMRQNVPGYVPYAEQQELWPRAWPTLRKPIEQAFGPYLNGKGDLRSAVTNLVSLL